MKKNFFADLWQQILINLGISIVIPLILYKIAVLDESQSILFGAMLAIISTTLEVLWYVKKIANREKIEQEAFSLKSDFSRRLAIIQQSFGNIVDKRYGEKDLFLQHFYSSVSELETQISKSDSQNELVTDRRHFSNITFVLDCFKEDSPNSIRAVHFLKDNDSFFENLSKTQFYAIHRLVPKKIKEVRRLIVFSSDDECHSPNSIKIIRFHTNTSGYSYKAIRADDYYGLLKLELHGSPDFTVYGGVVA